MWWNISHSNGADQNITELIHSGIFFCKKNNGIFEWYIYLLYGENIFPNFVFHVSRMFN